MQPIAIAALLLLTGCAALGSRPDPASPFAPRGIDRRAETVDQLEVGHRLMAAREYELALQSFYLSAAERGLDVDVLTALGSANLRLGRLGQAEALLRRAVAQDEGFAPAWNNLGVVLMERGEVAEASRVFRRAVAADDGVSETLRANLALALAKMEVSSYPLPDKESFALVRRGRGDYLVQRTD
ncbi:tetratricopeptide repeat protein [Palleronia aestuarii]|uniref:Tetratricopeptide repeat protein n=1 Tax=Palleronia aestuarii TaxID=568105 RepID=A0A2W7P2M2_9RHOB|nr:tetratricopeptide repeat protein [Palleronia aestuarii]PZX19676.1 tetratricopeptide repeat protein [Palleronia aestuarii]